MRFTRVFAPASVAAFAAVLACAPAGADDSSEDGDCHQRYAAECDAAGQSQAPVQRQNVISAWPWVIGEYEAVSAQRGPSYPAAWPRTRTAPEPKEDETSR